MDCSHLFKAHGMLLFVSGKSTPENAPVDLLDTRRMSCQLHFHLTTDRSCPDLVIAL